MLSWTFGGLFFVLFLFILLDVEIRDSNCEGSLIIAFNYHGYNHWKLLMQNSQAALLLLSLEKLVRVL